MKLFLIRHGDKAVPFTDHENNGLSDHGHAQALGLIQIFDQTEKMQPTHLFCSTLQRTRATLIRLSQYHRLPIQELCELDLQAAHETHQQFAQRIQMTLKFFV